MTMIFTIPRSHLSRVGTEADEGFHQIEKVRSDAKESRKPDIGKA